jgi:hypothetical protein
VVAPWYALVVGPEVAAGVGVVTDVERQGYSLRRIARLKHADTWQDRPYIVLAMLASHGVDNGARAGVVAEVRPAHIADTRRCWSAAEVPPDGDGADRAIRQETVEDAGALRDAAS